MVDADAIRQRWEAVGAKLDERGRRLFAAAEARTAGWGGLAMVSKINAHHVSLFTHLVDRMNKTQDGDGTLLDHSILLYGAGFGDGNLHNAELIPAMTVGGGCRTLKGGRIEQCPERTPLTNLGITLLDKVGIPVDHFGDSTGRLPNI